MMRGINTQKISWELVLKFILMLIEVLGKSEEQAVSQAASKFGVDRSVVNREFARTRR